ncbi:OmpA family protein [Echinicola pacifica]|nr:OmpA family protein [Echinicola pacifica]
MRKIKTILLLMVLSNAAFAQRSLLRYADEQMDQLNYKAAAELYEKAYEKKARYMTARNVAYSYGKINDYDKAYVWWEKALSYKGEYTQEDVKGFAQTAHAVNRYGEINDLLQQEDIDERTLAEWDFLAANHSPVDPTKVIAVEELNTNAADFYLTKDAAGNKYFVSDRGIEKSSSMKLFRLDARNKSFNKDYYQWTGRSYLSIYKQNPAGEIQKLTVDTEAFRHVSDPAFAEINGKTYLFFTATRGITKVKGEDEVIVYPELYYGILDENGTISQYEAFPGNSIHEYAIVSPYISQDNNLYFSSNMDGGLGGYDLYKVALITDSNGIGFGAAENLGEMVNTSNDERDPFIYNSALYFSSNGHQGYGGLDIYQSKINGETLGKVQNLGLPINSIRDDFAYRMFSDNELYLSSNRDAENGLDDIYKIRPVFRKFIAEVVDCNGNPIEGAQLEFVDAKGKNIALATIENNKYKTDLGQDELYNLSIMKAGYFTVSDNEISALGKDSILITKQYKLAKYPAPDVAVFTEIIYYDLDKSFIRRGEDDILNDVSALLNTYPELTLEVRSHTDSRASHKYNQRLSKRRANAVSKYLEAEGIDPDRLTLSWYGEEDLISSCPDGVSCKEELHQVNRRSELIIPLNTKKLIELKSTSSDYCEMSSQIEQLMIKANLYNLDMHQLAMDLDVAQIMALERLRLLMTFNPELDVTLIAQHEGDQTIFSNKCSKLKEFLVSRGLDSDRVKVSPHSEEELQSASSQSRGNMIIRIK